MNVYELKDWYCWFVNSPQIDLEIQHSPNPIEGFFVETDKLILKLYGVAEDLE